jgi:hypothetical protein
VLVGGLISWLITHFYYKKSTHDQDIVFGKLSVDIRNAILSNPGENIDSNELKILLENISTGPVDTSRLRGPIDGGYF